MAEENQNVVQSNWTDTQVSPIRFLANSLQSRKESIKNSVNNASTQQWQAELETMYEKSMTANNKDLCNEYDRECRKWEFAYYLKEKGKEAGYNTEWIANDALIDNYIQNTENPQLTFNIMKDYITHPEEDDITPYLVKLWWVEPTEEDEANSWFEDAWDNFTRSFWKAWQWFRTIWNDSNMYDRSWEIWALQDYVYEKYWPNATDEEWDEATRDFRIDNSIIDKYKDPETWIKDLIMWLPISLWNVTGLWALINIGTSAIAATWPWEKAFWYLWEKAETIWYYANKFPWLKQYRDELATEEDKRERDQFVWQEIIALITRWTIKWYKGIKKMSNDSSWGWGLFQKFQESRREKLNQKLQDTGGKIAWTKTVKERETATRALQDADIEWSKDYTELSERLKSRGKEIEAQEDIEYAKNERKWKPEETRSMKDFEKDWYKSSVLLKPIEDWIELLKDLYEWNPEKTAQLDLIEQKFKNEWLTKGEMNNIARAIVDEYDTYKKRWEPKPSMAAKDVEWIRRAIKEFAREGNDKLVELDKKWSDNLNTRQMISDIQDKIVNFTSNQRYKNVFQKLTWAAADIIVYLWWREVLQKLWLVSKEISWPNEYTPILRQSDLKKLTNKFTKLDKKLNWAKTKVEAEKVVEEFNNEMNEEFWPIEGEVIKNEQEWYYGWNWPKNLEDIVEINPR